jgi:hypothetical protein
MRSCITMAAVASLLLAASGVLTAKQAPPPARLRSGDRSVRRGVGFFIVSQTGYRKDLRRFLELRSQIKLCYVVIMRGHQVDGNFANLPFVRQPYNDAEHFPEFLDVLAAAAENSWDEPTDLFSTVSVHILPEKFAERGIRDVFDEIQGNPDALFHRERGGVSRQPECLLR